ncbi:MAG: phosphatidylglycerol lysyltransferase domain-containing protein [Clostridiales bacterium]|jgi:hypothetical protein|nr:phosphatidylglycerol lysyltransferase domain-containing protein [Clostridiales bacterium]
MKLNFRKIELSDQKIYDRILGKSHKFLGWEYSFAMIWTWDADSQTYICEKGGTALVYTDFESERTFFPPLLTDPAALPDAVETIADYCAADNRKFSINGLTKEQAAVLDADKYVIKTDRGDADYIYSAADLINLTGKKYHAKRNFVNRFTAKYEYVFRDYAAADYPRVLDLYDRWYENARHENNDLRADGMLSMERRVTERTLAYADALRLKIAVIESGGKIIAFSANKTEANGVAFTLLEKGDVAYEGIYQAVNQMSAARYFSGAELVNREEDMNVEGLRKAKLSYCPIMLLEKYSLTGREK